MALNFSKMNFSVSFNPTSAFPLDARSYFESYDLALAAAAKAVEAGSTEGTLYFGQTIAVVENSAAQLYIIQPDKTLTEVGSKITIDTNAFELDENGKLFLLGFAEATAGAQLVKGADGELSWVLPDNTTVEGLETTVAALQQDIKDIQNALNPVDEEGNPVEGGLVSDVKDLEESVGNEAVYDEEGNLVTPATGIFKDIEDIETQIGDPANSELNQAATGLYAELDKKANKADVYTKTETDTAIATAIANTDHLKREIVAALPSVEDADENTIYMIPSGLQEDDNKYYEWILIDGVFEQVGSWEVDLKNYATKDDVNAVDTKVNTLTQTVTDNKNALDEDISDLQQQITDEIARAQEAEEANAAEIAKKANAADVYTKSETNSAIADAVKDATGGESASDVLIALNNYKKAVNTEVWGSEVADESLTSTPSRIDALEEAVSELQNEEPYISSVTADFQVIDGQLVLNELPVSKIAGLTDMSNNVSILQTKVQSLEDILNGYTDEETAEEVPGLIAELEAIKTNYLTIVDFNSTVGNLEALLAENTTIVERIEEIEDALKWQDMPEPEIV